MKKTLFLSAILGAALCSSAFGAATILTINDGAAHTLGNTTGGEQNIEGGSSITVINGTLEIKDRLNFSGTSTLASTGTQTTFSGTNKYNIVVTGGANLTLKKAEGAENATFDVSGCETGLAIGSNATLTLDEDVTLKSKRSFFTGAVTGNGTLVMKENSSAQFTEDVRFSSLVADGTASFSAGATSYINAVTVNQRGSLTLSGTFELSKALTNNGALTLAENTGIEVKNIAATYNYDAYESQTDGFATGKEIYTVVSGNQATYSQVVLKKNGQVQDGYSFDGYGFTSEASKTTSRYMLVAEDRYTTTDVATTAPGATELSIGEGKTLVMDSTKWGLNKILGAGNVTVSVATTMNNSATSAATGILTVNGVQLSVGNGETQTSSLGSFASVVLDGGSIYYNNKKDTLHNVSVAVGKEGTITSYDMGPANDSALSLSGDTTVNGTLTLQNDWNAQFRIDNLLGSGDVNIKGVNANTYDTNSREGASYVLGLDSFTGTINISNNKATVKRAFATLRDMAESTTKYKVEGGSITNVCTADFTSGEFTMSEVDGELSGNVTGGTIDGNNHLTLSGQIAGGTVSNATYTNNNMTGGTFNNVKLAANERLNIHEGSVTLGNVTHATTGGSNSYAVVIWGNGALTINGTADFTTNSFTKIGIEADCTLTVAKGGVVTSGDMWYSSNANYGHVTVDDGGKLTVKGGAKVKSITNVGETSISGTTTMNKLTNSGTLTLSGAAINISEVTLNGGSVTLGTADSHDFNLITTALTVNGDATLNANLVMNSGTLSITAGNTLTMGCSVTIGETVEVHISGADAEAIRHGSELTIVNLGQLAATDVITLGSASIYIDDVKQNDFSLMRVDDADGSSRIVVAPEPATATLSLLALAALAARRKRH